MIFLTGFPGFLGSEIILRLLNKDPEIRFLCLVQEKFLKLCEAKREELELKLPGARNRIEWILGDITDPKLGIKANAWDWSQIKEVFHLAAIYDLNVAEAIAKKINVEGTRNVLSFLDLLKNLKRFHYVSTCYVSGRHPGVFLESDLVLGQSFNNFYESTKYEAEVLVREKMKVGLPTTIYRPSVVVGNSKTGETQKFDGPYYVIQWLLRQGNRAILPKMGDTSQYQINLVPSDYVLDSMAALCTNPKTLNQTFHLADPKPLTVQEVVQIIARDCEKKLIEIPIPKRLAKASLRWIPGLESWLKIPRSSLDYFVHPTRYDTRSTTLALEGTGVVCPAFPTYSKHLVEYMKKHPHLRSKALV